MPYLGDFYHQPARQQAASRLSATAPNPHPPPSLHPLTVITLLTKLCASCSTASPGCFSGAPVSESPLPNTPAIGFLAPPVVPSISDGGAGGKQNPLASGTNIRTTRNERNDARSASHAQATAYTPRKAEVRFHSRHDRRRTMCFQRWNAPTTAVMYRRSRWVLNLMGVKVSSAEISRSRPLVCVIIAKVR